MKSKGFTLVELIIVIAVIGVLAAILIPVFSNVIDKANAKSALSDAKNSMEQVIIEAAEKDEMPENILIIVKKAKNFYLYGFNRMTDGCLYQSPGNPFRNYSSIQSLIEQRSWNYLQGDAAPDLSTAYTDYNTYGYFYLVPYSGGTSQAPSVRSFRAGNEYPEISDPINGLMTVNMGDDVHIYHGVLTDKVNTDERTQGDTNATPTPAATPTPVATPTTEPTQPPQHYSVKFHMHNYDGTLAYNGLEQAIDESYGFDLVEGINRFTIEELLSSGRWPIFHESDEYYYAPVVQGTHTPLDCIDIILNDVNADDVVMDVYTDLVRFSSASGDETMQNYTVDLIFNDIDNDGDNSPDTIRRHLSLHLGTNLFTVAELKSLSLWPDYTGEGSYRYVPIDMLTHTVSDSISIQVYSLNTAGIISAVVYTDIVSCE